MCGYEGKYVIIDSILNSGLLLLHTGAHCPLLH